MEASVTASLAAQAAALATELNSLSERCSHENIVSDIVHISAELTLLSTTLCRLDDAMTANDSSYTDAFRQDLNEISTELKMIFEEVEECCSQLQKSDSPSFTGVAWFFRKGRVARLQKHLEALKTTVVVMRTVLDHGKEHGMSTSPGRLAESHPRTMSEDRAILESIFAENRNAISSLARSESRYHKHSSSTSSDQDPELKPGAHGRNLSSATGVEGISVPDYLPPTTETTKVTGLTERGNERSLGRRFTKRVGLGVHKTIIEIQVNDTEATLRRRWIKDDRTAAIMPSIVETTQEPAQGQSHPANETATTNSRNNSLALISSSIGKSLSRAIHRLSIRKGQENLPTSPLADKSGTPSDGAQDAKVVKQSVSTRLKHKFATPELTTPDYEREFENGACF